MTTDEYALRIERADGLRAFVDRARGSVGTLEEVLEITRQVGDAWNEAWEEVDRAIVLGTVQRYRLARVRAAGRNAPHALAMWRLVQIDEDRYGVAIASDALREAIEGLRANLPPRVVRVGRVRSVLWLPLLFVLISAGMWFVWAAVDLAAVH